MDQRPTGIITNLTGVIFVKTLLRTNLLLYTKSLHDQQFRDIIMYLPTSFLQGCVGPVHERLAIWRLDSSTPQISSSFPGECDSETDDAPDDQGGSTTYDRHAD